MNIHYEDLRNPNLPFGYWLIVADDGAPYLIDEDGTRWRTLREYIWKHRLGMGDGAADQIDTQLELLLAVLAAIDRRTVAIEERAIDLFDGGWLQMRHFGYWLSGHRLTTDGLTGPLTPEGKAILIALASTRSARSAPIPIGLPTLAPRRGLDGGAYREERERVFKAGEAFAQQLPDRFVRGEVVGDPGIKLIGLPEGANVPLSRTLWSMSFEDECARDRLFAWLVHRLDRWEAWAKLIRNKGATAFSEHLLKLQFADKPIEAD